MDIGKPVTSEKPVLFLESIYTFGLNDIEKEEVMKLAVSLTTQKAAELGVVAVLARRYLGCYERDEYVLAPFYVYISNPKRMAVSGLSGRSGIYLSKRGVCRASIPGHTDCHASCRST